MAKRWLETAEAKRQLEALKHVHFPVIKRLTADEFDVIVNAVSPGRAIAEAAKTRNTLCVGETLQFMASPSFTADEVFALTPETLASCQTETKKEMVEGEFLSDLFENHVLRSAER